jgi:hypothetical protein
MITALAPRLATSTEIARPRPVEAPVTTTTKSAKSALAMQRLLRNALAAALTRKVAGLKARV